MMVKVIVKIAVALGWRPDLSDPNNLRRTLPISIWRQRLFVLARVVQHNYRPYFAYLAYIRDVIIGGGVLVAKEYVAFRTGSREKSKHRTMDSPDYKSEVAQVAVMGEETVAQLPSRCQLQPSQLQAWKKALTTRPAGVSGNDQDPKPSNDAAQITRLYQKIGQLKVERYFLSERSGQYA